MNKKNKDLIGIYDKIYKKGERKHYAKYIGEKGEVPLEEQMVLSAISSYKGKKILDAGCGSGVICEEFLKRGAKEVVGVDYSSEAIKRAKNEHIDERLRFVYEDALKHTGKYDIIVSLGTLEHMNNPYEALKHFKKQLKPKGILILTCPNWTNPRGYILLTLQHLFDAPITLADLNYLTPIEFEGWAKKLKMKLNWETFDHDWSQGKKLVKDFERRLPNVLRDAKLPRKQKNIDKFTQWINVHIVPLDHKSRFSGALGLYVLKKV